MYRIKISPKLDEIIQKLDKKNKKQVDIILKKAGEIAENPHRYKNLRAPLNNLKRIHIDKHFVLIFSVNEESKTVTLENYAHHDDVYK
jgi:YafQ family addiction module toxin component